MGIIIIFILIFLLLSILIFMFGAILYHISKGKIFTKFYHDVLSLHIPIDKDKLSTYNFCRICGKEIMMDSQGNWF